MRVGVLSVPLMLVPLSACAGPSVFGDECRWTDAEVAAVEFAPLVDFLGVPTGPLYANCDMSTPDALWATASLSPGDSLPEGWQARQVIGEWALVGRSETSDEDLVLCYASSLERRAEVQILVFADGLAEASIWRGHDPCA